jgi:NAD(P)-dependent dehydrogenase (short-subunit alcohol dehydrogenase family)
MSPFSLAGQTALITGGGTGIGLGIAQAFIEAGARVALVGRREAELQSAINTLGSAAIFEVGDITCPEAQIDIVSAVGSRLGSISILVNSAGIHLKKPALDTTDAEMRSMLETHVIGAFGLTKLVARDMLNKGSGNILFIASMASFLSIPMITAYSTAKSAGLGMVRSLAAELSPRGIRVNAIAPGWIETPMLRTALNGDPDRAQRIISRTPLKRFGNPHDIGWAAVYLCSPAAAFVTGTVLTVDGGASTGF